MSRTHRIASTAVATVLAVSLACAATMAFATTSRTTDERAAPMDRSMQIDQSGVSPAYRDGPTFAPGVQVAPNCSGCIRPMPRPGWLKPAESVPTLVAPNCPSCTRPMPRPGWLKPAVSSTALG